MNKGIIFAGGVLLGAGVDSLITAMVLKKKYKDYTDDNYINESHPDALHITEEELVEYYISQLKELGVGVYDTSDDEDIDKVRTLVNPVEEDDYELEDEEIPAPIEPNPDPYLIDEKDFNSRDEYNAVTLHYYTDDETFTDDNYDIIDAPKTFFGDALESVSFTDAKLESVYIRNEVQMCDYELLIFHDSYKHVVEGEDEALGDMAD